MSFVLFGIWATFPGYGVWIASIKRRPPGEGLAFGLLLGPVGCVVEATLKERTAEEAEQERVRRQDEARSRLEREKERQDAFRAEADQRRKGAQERAEASRVRRAEASARFSDWFDRAVMKFGWYKALPEVAQPIVIGLLVALPLVIMMILFFRGR
jgi:hypothetical protein